MVDEGTITEIRQQNGRSTTPASKQCSSRWSIPKAATHEFGPQRYSWLPGTQSGWHGANGGR